MGAGVLAAGVLFYLGDESTPPWLTMLFDGGGVACVIVAAVAAGIWTAGLSRVVSVRDARANALCFTRGQFGDLEVHYLDARGKWQFNAFRDQSRGAALLQLECPGEWARYQRRYPELHVEDARMLARFDANAIRALAEIEFRHGTMIADLNRDIVHDTLDACALALARMRQARESAQRHREASTPPPDLAASQHDTSAIDRARRLPTLLADLEARMQRSKVGDAIDHAGLILFASENQTVAPPLTTQSGDR